MCHITKYSLCLSHAPVSAIAYQRRMPVVSRVKRSVSAMGVPHPLHTKHSGWYKRVSPADWKGRGRGRKGRVNTQLQHFCCLCHAPVYIQGVITSTSAASLLPSTSTSAASIPLLLHTPCTYTTRSSTIVSESLVRIAHCNLPSLATPALEWWTLT